MAHFTRRSFIQSGAAAAGALTGGSKLVGATKRSATDWVTLGNSGVKVTRLAMGTGGSIHAMLYAENDFVDNNINTADQQFIIH